MNAKFVMDFKGKIHLQGFISLIRDQAKCSVSSRFSERRFIVCSKEVKRNRDGNEFY